MNYHIVLSRAFDLETINRHAKAGKCPCHVMWEASQILNARIHMPNADYIKESHVQTFEQIGCQQQGTLRHLVGNPEHWLLASHLSQQLTEEDVVFCTGEDVGIPVAELCGAKKKRPKILVLIHNINRLRGRLALKLFRVRDKIDLFLTYTPGIAEFLRAYLHLPENRVSLFSEQPTDISFFTPGSASVDKIRPVIASGGLEKRDYRTLAAATEDLDIDVKICATSPNVKVNPQAFPKMLPNNMSCRDYEWLEFVQLYRDADIVVIPLFKNNYQAGLSVMFEAMACRRPVIITKSPGIIQELIEAGIVTGVREGDANDLRLAIVNLLQNPRQAELQAQRGYELVLQKYNHQKYIHNFVDKIHSFELINR
ncbi:glycosyltransferase [Calothrix sp. UHCC 0171]|uniref:glycosyltransferase n=1 Tax=Calothrix sp. UHCC 0171 TaxID=3110245 RepID=UPI002B212905|nr:glycosyltransferase [Calothrix sp. UHCC 0171]MEA5574200.1 glycosyltransferase [Calothrix sp. UHCC 0171]